MYSIVLHTIFHEYRNKNLKINTSFAGQTKYYDDITIIVFLSNQLVLIKFNTPVGNLAIKLFKLSYIHC